jgi:hypothetical protein
MSNAVHYRAEARRMLDWAEIALHPEMARRWRRLAEEYAALAEQLDAKATGRPPILRTSMQQQPQGKLRDK